MRATKTIDIFLMPGEYFVGGPEYRIRTLLGSCVSITLWHARRRVGAMSHFLLSERGHSTSAQPDPRYGTDAFQLMLQDLVALGVAPTECEAKVFGGGSMFPLGVLDGGGGIGRQNGELALQLLRARGIPVASECLYGSGHRSIIFSIDTGEVWRRQDQPAGPGATIIPLRPPAPPALARPRVRLG